MKEIILSCFPPQNIYAFCLILKQGEGWRAVWFTKRKSNLISAISKIDSKGRISIPIKFRAKLGWIEGNEVRIVLNKNKLIVTLNDEGTIDSKNSRMETRKDVKAGINQLSWRR